MLSLVGVVSVVPARPAGGVPAGDRQGRGPTANHRGRDTRRPASDYLLPPPIPTGFLPGENFMPEGLIDPAIGEF
jgi:hypothetical protein